VRIVIKKALSGRGKATSQRTFKLMPEHMYIEILESLLDEGESSVRDNIKYKKTNGKLINNCEMTNLI